VILSALGRSFILAAMTAATASAQIVGANADSIPSASWVRIYFDDFDGAARAAHLEPLRDTRLRSGEREIRIWTQVEIGVPKHLYRFTERNGRVRGERIEYWSVGPLDSSLGERPGETMHDLMIYGQRGRCGGFATASKTAICRVRFRREPPWDAVLHAAESHDLWALPDPSTLPSDSVMVLDGWTMVVELRDGPRYRTYRYNNPESHAKWPSAARAREVARTLSGIDSLAVQPDAWRTYRGITTGRYSSAFRSCDGDEWEFHDELRSLAKRTPPNVWSGVPSLADSTSNDGALYEVEVLGELSPDWLARRWESKYPRVLQVFELRAIRPAASPSRCGAR
jgi:hypothetical protein